MPEYKKLLPPLLIIVAGLVLFFPFLGSVHLFDWDEINFAESAREMIRTGDYLTVRINYLPFWEKPPLFIWMQVLSMKAFGVNEYAARFPNAIGGIVTLLVLYFTGKKLYSQKFGILWTLVYAGSVLPHFYFKSGIIDPWFNLFIFLGIYFMVNSIAEITGSKKRLNSFLSAFFTGLAVLTKGPVALLIVGLTALFWLIISKKWKAVFNLNFLGVFIITVSLTGGFWFLLQILQGKSALIIDFINYQIRLFNTKDAGHGGFLFYHFVVLFFGVFPASLFFLKSFKADRNDKALNLLFRRWMMITFWVVLILFTIVRTKIVHYSSMCYFPLTFLASLVIVKLSDKNQPLKGWLKWLLIVMGLLIGSLPAGMQWFAGHKDQIIAMGLIKDDFAVGNLQAIVNWSGFEFLIGLILIAGIPASLFFFRENTLKQIISIFVVAILFINLTILFIVPKVEQYSQRAAIEFFSELDGKNCYVTTWGYKSYAPYFYANIPVPKFKDQSSQQWLLTGQTDKPVYLATKNIREETFRQQYPDFKKLYEKNGFVFFVRQIKATAKQ